MKILAERTEKDAAFSSSDVPIPNPLHKTFLPLAYFPISIDYSVPAALQARSDSVVVPMQMSTGAAEEFLCVGILRFVLKGQSFGLTALVPVTARSSQRLFVPFHDKTNDIETYEGGRFLDIDRAPTGIYEIDFNRAYNPYCYYNATYACPVPPRENRLEIPIRAGEMVRHSN